MIIAASITVAAVVTYFGPVIMTSVGAFVGLFSRKKRPESAKTKGLLERHKGHEAVHVAAHTVLAQTIDHSKQVKKTTQAIHMDIDQATTTLKSQVAEVSSSHTQLQKTVTVLQQVSQSTRDDLQLRIEELEKQILELTATNHQLKSIQADMSKTELQLRDEVSDYAAKHTKLRGDLESSRIKVEELTSKLQKSATLITDIQREEARKSIGRLEQKVSALSSRLKATTEMNRKLFNENLEMVKIIRALSNALEAQESFSGSSRQQTSPKNLTMFR